MGKEYGRSTTVSSVFEASGAGGFFAVDTKSLQRKPIEAKKGVDDITKAWLINFDETTMDSPSETADDKEGGDVTNLLQTNLLLIAVLIVCFILLASMISICGCMIRRYCQNHGQQMAMRARQPTAVSKSTSITGLNTAREYYSTKVEQNNEEFSPAIIAHNTSEKHVSSEPNSNVVVNGPTGSPATTELNSATPQHPDIVTRVCGQNDDPFISTPDVSKSHCDNEGNVQCVDGAIDSILVDPQNQTTNTMSLQDTCDADSLVCDQLKVVEEIPCHTEKGNEEVNLTAEQVVMRAPLTHSVSWFVSLNGDRTGSIRHSITENTYQELNMKDYENCPPDKRNGKRSNKVKGRKDPECHPLYELDESDGVPHQPMMVSSNTLNNNSTCLDTHEDVPLIGKIRHSSMSESKSAGTKRSNLTSMVESEVPREIESIGRMSQSLSLPDDSNTWKQREERPVLFLGSGVK